ncbi:MAG: TetR family transcriptional regulator [Rhodospirillaceae bacterium]|nr:TetR family transcriptional regulator [Rhodospirillaceae bacterium]
MAAKKKSAGKESPSSSGAADPRARIVAAALREAAAVGWRGVTMEAVARRADMALGDVIAAAPTKAHLVAHIAAQVDAQMLARVGFPDATVSVRDRLFDVLMKRFDALQKHRDGFLALLTGLSRDPPAAAMALARLSRSMAAVLAAAGVSSDGLIGCARVHALKAVHLSALRAWRTDDSADMSKTMAALDKALNLAERAATFTRLRRPAEKKAA